jgi:inhibitor of KinA
MKQHETTQRWRCVPFGEAALLLEASGDQATANRAVLALAEQIVAVALRGVVVVQPALTSLLVQFDPLHTTHAAIERVAREHIDQLKVMNQEVSRIVTIPVRYGGDDGPDLDHIAQQLAVTPDQVIALHTGQMYRVLMLGFAPGFPYIGPLPSALTLPRRATPRTAVPAGSVAIAAGMTGVYPQRLPGGWHLIGRTDAVLFDPQRSPPSLLQAGDDVQFVAAHD